MTTMIIPACTNPPQYWDEDPKTHTATCRNCDAVKDMDEAHKKMLTQPKGNSTPSELSDPYFVPVARKIRKAWKKATAY